MASTPRRLGRCGLVRPWRAAATGPWGRGTWSRIMGRVISVWLPDWPVTVWSRAAGPPPEGAPFALVERTTRGLVLTAVNPAARALGLRRGQAHADARAIAPQLESAPAEPDHEREALERLALWAERFSPCVAIDRTLAGLEGLFIDMTGGAHLFGGEDACLAEIERRLEAAAIPARAAIADTPGAAWALARFGETRTAPAGRGVSASATLLEAMASSWSAASTRPWAWIASRWSRSGRRRPTASGGCS